MEARVKFSQSVLKQTGTVGKILQFIQNNPNSARNTNVTLLAKTMSLGGVGKENTLNQVINKMLNNQMLTRWGGKRHANFRINYFQPDIPGYILEKAPEEERKRVERMKAEMTPNQYISKDGCIVTPGTKKVEEESTIIEPEKPNLPELKEDKPEEETLKSSSDASEENTTSVPVVIRDTERGLSISITLNLTINK